MAHWIQEHVLKELIRHKTRRYSELKPRDVEGNLFMYHLKGLLCDGYIEKSDRQYMLSREGIRYAAQLSLSTGRQRKQPVVLNCIIAQNSQGEFLFVRWRRQPNFGLISFPHGMMHFGEGSDESAKRELAEKSGLVGEISYLATVLVRSFQQDEIDRHMVIRLFTAKKLEMAASDALRTEASEPFWAHLESLAARDFIPGFYEIANYAATGEPLPVEILYKDDSSPKR